MKPVTSTSQHQDGVALIIVLGMLVLMSGLLVSFMTLASNERVSTEATIAGADVRQIADSTVNLVIGTIREATTSKSEGVSWASQPGAIRTFSGTIAGTTPLGNGGYFNTYSPGGDDSVFKLYSASNMKVNATEYDGSDLPNEVSLIDSWERSDPKKGYVDLNEPALIPRLDLDSSGDIVEPRYPIIDPRAKDFGNGSENRSAAWGVVEGFDGKIDRDPVLKVAPAKQIQGAVVPTQSAAVPYLPMPVEWLYVLADGSIGQASAGTANNPIVGRTAFWVDDESCKLNINTSSEGTFWDTPSVGNEQDSGQIPGAETNGALTSSATSLSLGASQPGRGEYQRFPGHPLTTSLSPALGWLWGITPATDIHPMAPSTGPVKYSDFKDAIYRMSPFLAYGTGTSRGATRNTEVDGKQKPLPEITTKHLYATVDDMVFGSQRTSGGQNASSVINDIRVTPEALERTRFFLTANSRAPEVNLFGRPRVTLWPINADFEQRTQYDDLFAFASIISVDPNRSSPNDKGFFLTRRDATSATVDALLPQNVAMFSYLQKLTGGSTGTGLLSKVPGFGSNLFTKYKDDRDQLLVSIFDYMRTVNLVDTGTASRKGNQFIPYTPKFFSLKEGYGRRERSFDWSGQVIPLKMAGRVGMGRFITLSEAALVFYRSGTVVRPAQPPNMQAVLVLEMATAMPGLPALRETYFTKVRQNAVSPLPLSIQFPGGVPINTNLCQPLTGGSPDYINLPNVSAHEVTFGRAFMPVFGFSAAMHYFQAHPGNTQLPRVDINSTPDPNRNATKDVFRKSFDYATVNPGSSHLTTYPYIGREIPIPPGATTFTFTGTSLILEIWAGESPKDPRAGSEPVQTIELNFPAAPTGIPVPFLNYGTATGTPPLRFDGRFDSSLDGRWDCINYRAEVGTPPVLAYEYNDVVRSIELSAEAGGGLNPAATRGDVRLVASRSYLPQTAPFYKPTGGARYAGAEQRVHALTVSHGEAVKGHIGAGVLAANGTNRSGKPAILPVGIAGVQRADGGPGDYDRGLSKHMDGAFGNKVDEGNVSFKWDDGTAYGKIPYYRGRSIEETGQSFFTPNRQLPSAVMLGSLPTGVQANKPWQTLLFRPDRELSGARKHPGAFGTPDHILLDLFTLPIVEPYSISEPFSTAGKVNMNHVIAPFGYAKGDPGMNPGTSMPRSYLRRDTAVRGVLKSTFVMGVPTAQPDAGHADNPLSVTTPFRFPIDLDRTIEQMDVRQNDQRSGKPAVRPFRSATEICDVDLFPKGVAVTNWQQYWAANAQTGDNMRERPYAHIYPRLTTKSNVYTVHMRCQKIRKSRGSKPDEFDEGSDQISGEYRGSAMIERFIDPNDPLLANYQAETEKVDAFYRFRVVQTKQFAPR